MPKIDFFGIRKARARIRSLEERINELESAKEKGREAWSSAASFLSALSNKSVTDREFPKLTNRLLYRIYSKSSEVRACIDRIAWDVANSNIEVIANKKTRDVDIRDLKLFLTKPNFTDQSFQDLIEAFVRDLLIYDVGIMEKVFDKDKTRLLELYVRDPKTIEISEDKKGGIKEYIQRINGKIVARFNLDEILRVVLHPSSSTVSGRPIIESIINEVASLVLSSDSIAKSFTETDLPSGLLLLGDISDKSFKRIIEDIKGSRYGVSTNRRMVAIRAKESKWIDFKSDFKALQVSELRDEVERVIWREFGFPPAAMGDFSKMRAANIDSPILSTSTLIQPIISKLEYALNSSVLPQLNIKNVKLRLKSSKPPYRLREIAYAIKILVSMGVFTPEEAKNMFFSSDSNNPVDDLYSSPKIILKSE